jgi:hypothetical protein
LQHAAREASHRVRNVQSAAMDMPLRLIRDVPTSIPYLRDRAA